PVLTIDKCRFTLRRARLAPAMISTPGHRPPEGANAGPCQPGRYSGSQRAGYCAAIGAASQSAAGRCKKPSPWESSYDAFTVVVVRMSALRLSAAIRPSMPWLFRDRRKFGAAGRHLADRTVEIDVGDQPAVAVAAHHVVNVDRLAVGLDDLAAHRNAS